MKICRGNLNLVQIGQKCRTNCVITSENFIVAGDRIFAMQAFWCNTGYCYVVDSDV